MAYAELVARSCYSLLDGASQPEELCEAAASAGVSSLGLADRDGVYGLVAAHQAALRCGVRLVCGAMVTVLDRPGVVLLVTSREGWSSLCRLLTRGRASQSKGYSCVPIDAVAEHQQGLLCLLRPGFTESQAAPLRDAFGDRLYLMVSRDLSAGDPARVAAAQALSLELGRPLLATNDVRMHARHHKVIADTLTAIRRKVTLAAAGLSLAGNAERILLDEASFRMRYADLPDAMRTAEEAAQRCTFSLAELRYGYPDDVVPEGQTPMSWLRELTRRGLAWRYPTRDGGVPISIREMADRELVLIESFDHASYFLIVFDLVRFARSRGILCQGRGAAANSVVGYALGITAVDPHRSALLFERFGDHERSEPPDIDLDVEHERREEVIQYIYTRYGRDRAGMVNEFVHYRPRSAVREVGRAFGLSLDKIDRLVRALEQAGDNLSEGASPDRGSQQDLSRTVFAPLPAPLAARIANAGLDPEAREVRGTLQVASSLEGLPRHLSIHVGGFVISSGSLADLVPIEPATMLGRTVLQWDKRDVEALSFVKLDILALGALTAIRKAFELIQAAGGPSLTLARVPPEDPAVYDLLCRADTMGIFQMESRAQMSILPRIQPRCFYDLVIAVALLRPGPREGGVLHSYLRRRIGEEAVTFTQPSLELILARTLGIPLFQEQIVAMAVVVCGFSLREAEQLRRSMESRQTGVLREEGARLVRAMTERGIARGDAEEMLSALSPSESGFSESHAASFALLVYVCGWLKCYWPAAFTGSLVNSQPMGLYSTRALLADAQRHGVEVRPLCVMHSSYDCTLERDRHTTIPPSLRLGLRMVRGISAADADSIASAREKEPFVSLPDFARRTGLGRSPLQSLAEAGAFDALTGTDRRQAAWVLQGLWTDLPLFVGLERREPPLGTILRPNEQHPVSLVRDELDEMNVATLATLDVRDEQAFVKIAGIVSTTQRPRAADGIVCLTIEDETGLANLVVASELWEAYRKRIRTASLLGADGRVRHQGEAVTVSVERFWELPSRGQGPPAATTP